MAITVAWDNESKSVLRLDFEGRWDWPDYNTAIDEAYAIIKQTNDTVHLISNMPQDMALPQGLPLRHLRRAHKLMPANVGQFLVVGGNWAAQTMLLIFRHYDEEKIVSAKTLDEARALLSSGRPLPVTYSRANHILL
jgi:hypothetical protein